MSQRIAGMFIVALALAVCGAIAFASVAEAKSRKHKKRHAASAAYSMKSSPVRSWGQNLVPAGPLYNGPDYLGTDPDPNIRSQILRDLTGRYGGID